MAGSARHSSEFRQAELADAALHLIATRGIAALSTRSLAAVVGLSGGAIFRHFASLDLLLDAVAARVEALLDATFPPPDLPPRERLARFVDARSAAVGQHAGIQRLMLSEQFRFALPAGGSARLGGCVTKTRAFVMECLRQGQATGVFRDDIDPASLAVVVMGTLQMLALLNAQADAARPDPAAVRAGLLVMLEGPRATSRAVVT